MNRRIADRRGFIVHLLTGVLVTMVAFQASESGTRYIVFGVLGALFVAVLMAVPDRRRFILGLFVLCLQLDASMFFSYAGRHRSTGWSGPPGIELPLSFFASAAVFITAWFTAGDEEPRSWTWGGATGMAAIAVVATTAMSLLVSSERFYTACYTFQVMQLLVALLAMANIVRDRRDFELVLRLFTVTLVAQATVYFIESATGATFAIAGDVIEQGGGRHGGTVGVSPADFGSFMLPLLMIATAQIVSGATSKANLLVAGAGLLALLLTYTRASWIACGLGLAVMITLGLHRRMVSPRRVALFCLVAVAGVAAAYPKMATRLAHNVADSDERWALMVMAMQVIKAHPLLGIGGGVYGFVFTQYISQDLMKNWLYVVHNAYLLRWAETGVPGIAATLCLIGFAFRDAYKLWRSNDRIMAVFGLGWLGALIALCWEMWWDVWRGFTYNALLWTLCGFAVAARRVEAARDAGGLATTTQWRVA